MTGSRRASTAPWIVSAVAGAVLVAAVVVYFVVLRPDQDRVVGAFTSTETTAVNAAAQEVTNTLSYRRAHFEADFQRALAGTTGGMKSDLQGKKSAIQSAMTKGKFDLSAQVTHKALVGPVSSGKQRGYEVIVTINGYRSTAMDAPSPNNLDVTVVRSGGKWLLAGITNIGTT